MTIFADANATYPVDPTHYDDVARALKEVDGNPSSIHTFGRHAKVALENARGSVARMLGCGDQEVVFTSGATESNNLLIQGLIGSCAASGRRPEVVVSAVEHPSVLETVAIMEERGLCQARRVPVTEAGVCEPQAVLESLTENTVLVCVMHANNEVGSINPIRELAERLQAAAPALHLHVDAVQMFGKADLTWYGRTGIGSAAISAHKIGGFKGCGGLYLKAGRKLNLLLAGGGQERGRRPGTENMPGVLSLGMRCDQLRGREEEWCESMAALKGAWLEVLQAIPGAVVHGDPGNTLPNTVNFHVEGVPGDDILLNFDLAGIAAASGSACSSGVGRPSHVLRAMGLGEWEALNSIRVSFDHRGTKEQVARMGQVLRDVISRVRG